MYRGEAAVFPIIQEKCIFKLASRLAVYSSSDLLRSSSTFLLFSSFLSGVIVVFGYQSLLCSLRSRRTLFAAGLRPCLRVHILHFPLLYNAVSGCAASLTLCGSNCCNNFTVPLPYFPSSLVFTSTYLYPFLVPCRSSAAHHLRDRYVGALSADLSITGKHRYIPPAYLTLTADISDALNIRKTECTFENGVKDKLSTKPPASRNSNISGTA